MRSIFVLACIVTVHYVEATVTYIYILLCFSVDIYIADFWTVGDAIWVECLQMLVLTIGVNYVVYMHVPTFTICSEIGK